MCLQLCVCYSGVKWVITGQKHCQINLHPIWYTHPEGWGGGLLSEVNSHCKVMIISALAQDNTPGMHVCGWLVPPMFSVRRKVFVCLLKKTTPSPVWCVCTWFPLWLQRDTWKCHFHCFWHLQSKKSKDSAYSLEYDQEEILSNLSPISQWADKRGKTNMRDTGGEEGSGRDKICNVKSEKDQVGMD